jgi:hypothetical protein
MSTQPTSPITTPIVPGTIAKWQIAPTFSGTPFQLDLSKVGVTSSDTTNLPVALDPNDTTGTIVVATVPANATIPVAGTETIQVTWSYNNTDGNEATVVFNVDEQGAADDVTGGVVTRIA